MNFTTLTAIMAFLASSGSAKNLFELPKVTPVPGNTPFEYCLDSFENSPVKITNLSFSPEKPKKGDEVTITLEFNTTQPITDGTKIHYNAKWHSVGKSDDVDFCKTVGGCPINGVFNTERKFTIPKKLPGHKNYHGRVEIIGPDDTELVCIQGRMKL